MRLSRIFFVMVFLICAAETLRLWFIAPSIMAGHFNIQGLPDRFDTKGAFFYFEIQIMLTILAALIVAEGLLYIIPVEFINLPNKEYWLAPDRHSTTIARIGSFLEIIFSATIIVTQAAFELAANANLHKPIIFASQYMIPIIVGFFTFTMLALVLFALSFRLPSSE